MLSVRKPLQQLNDAAVTTRSGGNGNGNNTPFLLSLVAEEVGALPDENNTSTMIDVAIIIRDETNDPPEFNRKSYVAYVAENAAVGTELVFSLTPSADDRQTGAGAAAAAQVTDHDQGHDGIFSLSLAGDNGTFEIWPPVAENSANFVIRVKNPTLIDYETVRQINFKIVARGMKQQQQHQHQQQQQGAERFSTADVTVFIQVRHSSSLDRII